MTIRNIGSLLPFLMRRQEVAPTAKQYNSVRDLCMITSKDLPNRQRIPVPGERQGGTTIVPAQT